MFDYEPYRELLKKRNIKQYDLTKEGIINSRIANQLKHNRSITLETLDSICTKLDCDFSDIVRHYKE